LLRDAGVKVMYVECVANFLNSSPSRYPHHSVRVAIAFIIDIVPTKEMLFAPSVEGLITISNE
jgi:hypothetical protein